MPPTIPSPQPTERLLLIPSDPSWAAAMAEFQRANAAHLDPWSPAAPAGFYTEAWWAEKLAAEVADRAAGRGTRLLLVRREAPDVLVGWANFTTVVRGVWHCCNLGYAIGQAYEGQGLMKEGVRGGVAHVFDDWGLHRIQANYVPRNERSGRVLRALGFRVEGYAYDYLYINGRWEDHVLTSLTNPRWVPRTP